MFEELEERRSASLAGRTGREGRRSNPDLVWERISELHARLRQRQQHEDAAGRDQHCG
jgi:hypothetical protein